MTRAWTPSIAELLDELEHDALTELVNIGVNRAAAGLREMVGEQVHLSVPSLSLVSRANAVEILKAREPDRLVAVHQQFAGEISGRALLIFPETKSLELVRAVTGGHLPLEDIVELEQEALAETGNIVLNACLGTIANLLERSLKLSLPEVLRGEGQALITMSAASDDEVVLFLYIDFAVLGRDLRGYIVLLMDMPSLTSLKGLIKEFVARAVGPKPPQVA